jgi:hypothetical protein
MSLIACNFNHSFPVIIGDILVSSNVKPVQSLKLPTFLKGMREGIFDGKTYIPDHLMQKIYVINPKVSVALAGNVFEMRMFLDDMQSFFKNVEVSRKNVKLFIGNYDNKLFEQISCLVIISEIIENQNVLTTFRYGYWDETSTTNYQTSLASGSGSKQFFKVLHESTERKLLGNVTSSDLAIANTMLLVGSMLIREKITFENILMNWGAGFEIIYFDGRSFIKADNVLHIFWEGIYKGPGDISYNPVLALKNEYFGETLCISSTDFTEIRVFGVLPLSMIPLPPPKINFKKETIFISKYLCSTYLIRYPNGKIYDFSLFATDTITNQNNFIQINFTTENTVEVKVQDFIKENLNKVLEDHWVSITKNSQ